MGLKEDEAREALNALVRQAAVKYRWVLDQSGQIVRQALNEETKRSMRTVVIPGKETYWFVFDRHTKPVLECDSFSQACLETCEHGNAVARPFLLYNEGVVTGARGRASWTVHTHRGDMKGKAHNTGGEAIKAMSTLERLNPYRLSDDEIAERRRAWLRRRVNLGKMAIMREQAQEIRAQQEQKERERAMEKEIEAGFGAW